MQSPEPSSSSPVLLNIGGKKHATTVETLTQREPDSMLAAMFSGRHTLPHHPTTGMVFVDRDGKHFRHVLNWLRDGAIPVLSESEYQQLLREAEYYQLIGLADYINERLGWKKADNSEAELTRKDVIKCIQAQRVRFRGVNLSGLDLSKLVRTCQKWTSVMHASRTPIFHVLTFTKQNLGWKLHLRHFEMQICVSASLLEQIFKNLF
uniref:BTB domain-containing protein n=1 Tax=Arundo donax TaxID=35708 RepID=A0A0A9BB32_ARUDO